MKNYKRIVKISFSDILNRINTEILIYEDGFIKIADSGNVYSKRILPRELKKIKTALEPYIIHPQDYIKISEDENFKSVILITNPFNKRPYTKVVNDKILFKHLLDIIKE